MDFAKNLIKHENVITKSGIKLLDLPSSSTSTSSTSSTTIEIANHGDDKRDQKIMKEYVDELLVKSANKAATHLFLSKGVNIVSTMNKSKEKGKGGSSVSSESKCNGNNDNRLKTQHSLVDCSLYPTQLLPPCDKIVPSSLVVIFESFDCLDFVYAKPGEVFHNRNGHFYHDDFINKPYGSKIRSRNNQGVGFVYVLKPTPELWQRSLNHRTQIVHELDASLITFELNLRPNMTVCESGTGSGALSHCIMRAIAPFGKLHTFEFNHTRVQAAREEFKKNGVDHLVDVHWRDVCGKPKSFEGGTNIKTTDCDDDETIGVGGFAIGAAKADAIFLDLPEPWLAIPHVAHTIKPNGSVCSYSPCVEQSQQTIQEMMKYGFHTIKTIEVRLREHYVDEVSIERVPTGKLPREPLVPFIPGESGSEVDGKKGSKDDVKTTNRNPSEIESEGSSNNKRSSQSKDQELSKKQKMLCARPFATIKGHTAFLTFANAGNKSYPDPNKGVI